ncbi:MAG: glucosyltransferase domain-containing protein [Streptococcaceae bacterium]|nr:glucosyltransferase domain-containing protein [Streptococcaceae bacterium]
MKFLIEKKKPIGLIFFIYSIAFCSIGLANYPYIDDTARRITGENNFGLHYSRWGSEIFSWIIQGSKHLSDRGLTSFLLTAVILTATSTIMLYVLLGERTNYISATASVIIGLNPWYLNAAAFRIDGPLISMSLLLSVLPFIFWRKKLYYLVCSIISIFLMYNFYQASSGIYWILVLTLALIEILRNEHFKRTVIQLIFSIFSFIIGTIFYLIQLKFLPATDNSNSKIVSGRFFEKILANINAYGQEIFQYSLKSWLILGALIVLFFIVVLIIQCRIRPILVIAYSLIYLVLSFIAGFGLYSFLNFPVAHEAARYSYGFGFWIAAIAILTSQKINNRLLTIVKNTVILALTYYFIMFVFTFSNMLQVQKDSFTSQSILLQSSLVSKDIYQKGDEVFIDKMFNDSPIFINTTKNFEIMKQIIPSNSIQYWPNWYWFQEITGITLQDASSPKAQAILVPEHLVESNYRWDIYKSGNVILIISKAN